MSIENPTDSKRSSGFIFVFITVALDMLAIGLIIPVLPNLINKMTGGDIGQAAITVGAFSACWALMQFMFMPIMGGLSDQYGRKPILLISNFGQAASNVLTALAPSFVFLLIARLISGAVSAVTSTANAYIADIEPPEKRAQKFGMLGAAFGLGFILGPSIGGYLGKIDIHLPFWAAAVMCTINGIYGLFILPESLKREDRTPFKWKNANPVGSVDFLKSNPKIFSLAIIRGLCDFAHVVYPTTFVLYGLYRYGWQSDVTGLTLGLVGVSSMVVQVGLVGPIIKALGEVRTLVFGLACAAVAFTMYGLAPTGYWFWAAMPLAAISGVYGPAIQGLLTRQVGPHEQGRLQGAIGSVQAATSMIGPIAFAGLFTWAISDARTVPLPGAAFCLAGVLLAIALTIAVTNAAHLKADQADAIAAAGGQ